MIENVFITDEKIPPEMYMDLILANNPNPILLFNSQEKLAYANESCFQFHRTAGKDDILGKNFHELFAPLVSEKSMNELGHLYNDAISEGHMFTTVQEFNFDSQKSSRHFEIQITPMADGNKNIAGIIIFLFDMTEYIQARREAERARERAEQSSRSKSGFLAKMSHEIRTPMNAILGMAELALREDIAPSAEENIRTIMQAGLNLLSIINDILDFSKIEAGKLEIIPVEYLFSSLANDVINIIKARVLESRLRFVVNIDCNIPNALFGDVIRIRQVLLNLLSNAVKYTERGFVAFSVSGEIIDDESVILTLEVTDSGKGIRPEEIGRLFDEFARFDIEKHKDVEGTGLGLAICQNLVISMGGKIDVHSEYGKGSSFTVTLPQKIRQKRKLAVVKDPEEKSVLVYERREIYNNSIARTMKNLGVDHKIVSTASDFHDCLVSKKYSYVFLASALYEEFKRRYSEFKSDAKFAVIAEFGEAITERNISTLTMPIFSIPITNFLNGISDNYTSTSRIKTVAKLIAPDAKVLVVDDIHTNLKVAEGLLSPYKMQVKLCKSGLEAIKEMKLNHYDLVLMDQMMPEMDGIETVSYIRALEDENSYYKNVPIVALTADAVFGAQELLLKNGFDDFLSKPIDTIKLNDVLERWIPDEKKKVPTDEDDSQNILIKKSDAGKEFEIEGLDTEKGLAMTGGKIKIYLNLLSIFRRDGIEKIREIKTCLEENNLPLYAIHIHALKSASAMIGATRLSMDAEALEEAGKRGSAVFVHAHNGEFLENLETLLQNINLALLKEAESNPKELINTELLKNDLSRLKKGLNSFNPFESNKAANALQEFTQVPFIGDSVRTILQNKLIGEYDKAVAMIDDLIRKLNV